MAPSGPKSGEDFPTTTEWKTSVRMRLAELRMSMSDLARAIDVTPAAISYALGPAGRRSSLVPAIERAVEWEPTERALKAAEAGKSMTCIDCKQIECDGENCIDVVYTKAIRIGLPESLAIALVDLDARCTVALRDGTFVEFGRIELGVSPGWVKLSDLGQLVHPTKLVGHTGRKGEPKAIDVRVSDIVWVLVDKRECLGAPRES